MKLTKKGEYACLSLIALSRSEGTPLKIREIAEKMDIPKKYLEQILLQLKTAGYVQSIRGFNGGYVLARKPKQISVAEIVRLIDGPIASTSSVSDYYYLTTPIEKEKKLHSLLREIRNYVAKRMEETSFQDLLFNGIVFGEGYIASLKRCILTISPLTFPGSYFVF